MAVYRLGFAAAIALSASVSAAAKDDTPTEITLSGDYAVDAVIVRKKAEDVPIRFAVDGASPGAPVLNPELVAKADIKSGFIGSGFRIGPILLKGKSSVVRYRFDALEWKRRSIWVADKPYAPGFDGGLGPGGLPYNIVRFQWRPEQPGEQTCTLKAKQKGAIVTELKAGEKTIDIGFTHKRRQSLATAAAGAVIADSYDGAFIDDREQREKIEIAYGVERPIRQLALTRPLQICDTLSLDRFYVRTADFGDASTIAEAETEDADNSEIVVIAKKGKKDKNSYFLTIGQDDLQQCSSVTYDKVRGEIRLSCGTDTE